MEIHRKMDYSYPFLGKEVTVTIDRPMGSKHPKYDFEYPVNYGYIKGTRAPDGEELDAYVLGIDRPLKTYRGVCIAIIQRLEDDDDKLIVVPKGLAMSEEKISSLTSFQEQYFKTTIIFS